MRSEARLKALAIKLQKQEIDELKKITAHQQRLIRDLTETMNLLVGAPPEVKQMVKDA